MSLLTSAWLLPVRVYQRAISPLIGPRCKYYPSCSAYAVQAVEEYGILRGSLLAGWRVLRCNPWSHGGFDPVTAKTLFRTSSQASKPSSDT